MTRLYRENAQVQTSWTTQEDTAGHLALERKDKQAKTRRATLTCFFRGSDTVTYAILMRQSINTKTAIPGPIFMI